MNSKPFQYLIALISLLSLFGCNEYLNENPDNRVDLKTPEQAAQLVTNAYSSAGYTFTEWMSDNVSFTTGTTKLPEHNQAYEWENIISPNQDTPTNFWMQTYDAIAHANEVLAVIDKMQGSEDLKAAVKGEAYLARAYGHFMLVNLFAKHYNKSTASADPGVPYVLEPETVFVKKYTRNSVQDVYDKVEADLLNGLNLVSDQFYANSGKYHFNTNAALAFASRFYLFKGDWDNCVKYSSQLLKDDPTVYLKDLKQLVQESANPDNFLQLYTSPDDPSNLLLIRQVTNFPVTVGYWPSPDLFRFLYQNNPWDADDLRIQNEIPIYLRGSGLTLGKYMFLFERSSLTSNVGLYYTIMPAFRGEEVLLNRIESYINTKQLSKAAEDFQTFISMRYEDSPAFSLDVLSNYYNGNTDAERMQQYLEDERQKEFLHEGLRWFDIKRFNIRVKHDLEDGSEITLAKDDKRKLLQIPQSAIDVGGLEPNPR